MGAGNVKAAFVHWGALPGGPFRLLVYMALRTRDGDARPRYYGGREDLAFGLGRRVPDDDGSEESRKAREASFKAVKDAVATLTRRGAVRVVARARPGRNAEYELVLDPVHGTGRGTVSVPHEPVDNPVDNPDMGDGFRTPNGGRFSSGMGDGFPPQRGTVFVGMGHENRPPKEEKDESGLSRGGDGEGFPAPDPPATAPPDEQDQHNGGTPGSDTPNGQPWTYRAACEYLMSRPGTERDKAERLATQDLGPGAEREAVLIRAAHHAHRIATGVPA
ncbi:hypothetical protein [Actinomadura sp. CNU-125]|uniref:hypothetical protein n=1 Tax=Actinomadura sp. CNU-125 TaxID=1904961 RepID=UPI00117749B3|nr:hypothetical protein [Actinomadura sp. CNU-125]